MNVPTRLAWPGTLVVCMVLALSPAPLSGGVNFTRGDSNGDGGIDISDVITVLNYLIGGPVLPCFDGGDHDDSGVIDIVDAVYLASFLFVGTAPPPPPFPGCGADPTADALDCLSSPCP